MKGTAHLPKAPAKGPAEGPTKGVQPGVHRQRLPPLTASQRRAQQKSGGYKRIEIMLGMEAAIALRQLMRDGRSARDVIEELLLAAKLRRKEPLVPGDGL